MKHIILATKKDAWCDNAVELAQRHFGVSVARSERPSEVLELAKWATADALISYRCPVVFPDWVLDRFETAINFHPGSSDYPGRGYNFAIYEGAKEYGVVCHNMAAKVDTGAIVEERRFPLRHDETLATLFVRTQCELLALFANTLDVLAAGHPLPSTDRQWTRPAITQKMVDDLARVTAKMSKKEVRLRARAFENPGYPGLETEIAGLTFRQE